MSVAMRVVVLLAHLGAAFSLRKGRASQQDTLEVNVLDRAAGERLGQYLGWSFDVDSNAPLLVSVKQYVFDTPADDVHYVKKTAYDSVRSYAEDSAYMSIQNNKRLGLEFAMTDGVSAFDAAAEASTQKGRSSTYKTFRADVYEKVEKYHVTSKSSDRASLLTADARTILLNGTSKQIEGYFGAFYATDMRLGAVLRFSHIESMSWKETIETMTTKFDAGYKEELGGKGMGGTGSFTGEYEEVTNDESRDVQVARMVRGGRPEAWLDLDATSSNLDKVKKKWKLSLTDDNLVPVEMSLLPIWNLLQGIDNKKAKKVKNYFEKKWKAEKTKFKLLPEGPAIIECNWADHSSICSPLNLVPGCHDDEHCINKGWESCRQTGWPYSPGMRGKCVCKDTCRQDHKNSKPCCPTDVSR